MLPRRSKSDENPFATVEVGVEDDVNPKRIRWHVILAGCLCGYYLVSCLTLPFAKQVWFGEIPVLGLLQIPKAFLKSLLHSSLMEAMKSFGWTGSSSDYFATHSIVMVVMLFLPTVVFLLLIWRLPKLPFRPPITFAMLACSCLDAIVTIWFENTSSLKLFNGVLF